MGAGFARIDVAVFHRAGEIRTVRVREADVIETNIVHGIAGLDEPGLVGAIGSVDAGRWQRHGALAIAATAVLVRAKLAPELVIETLSGARGRRERNQVIRVPVADDFGRARGWAPAGAGADRILAPELERALVGAKRPGLAVQVELADVRHVHPSAGRAVELRLALEAGLVTRLAGVRAGAIALATAAVIRSAGRGRAIRGAAAVRLTAIDPAIQSALLADMTGAVLRQAVRLHVGIDRVGTGLVVPDAGELGSAAGDPAEVVLVGVAHAAGAAATVVAALLVRAVRRAATVHTSIRAGVAGIVRRSDIVTDISPGIDCRIFGGIRAAVGRDRLEVAETVVHVAVALFRGSGFAGSRRPDTLAAEAASGRVALVLRFADAAHAAATVVAALLEGAIFVLALRGTDPGVGLASVRDDRPDDVLRFHARIVLQTGGEIIVTAEGHYGQYSHAHHDLFHLVLLFSKFSKF